MIKKKERNKMNKYQEALDYQKAVEALERIRLETSNVCVNTNLDIIEETLKQTKENVIEQAQKEHDELEELKRVPTAEEVRKAIEDEVQWNTVYEDNQFNFDVGGYLIKMDDKARILYNCHPTPKLSELVGRFYGDLK
jgi:hypothetical protein